MIEIMVRIIIMQTMITITTSKIMIIRMMAVIIINDNNSR